MSTNEKKSHNNSGEIHTDKKDLLNNNVILQEKSTEIQLLIIKLLHFYPHLPHKHFVCRVLYAVCNTRRVLPSSCLYFNLGTSVERLFVSTNRSQYNVTYEFLCSSNSLNSGVLFLSEDMG